ncbi:MAG: hypothetical protein M1453_10165 [Acidobacteria bacterium]|nr:hypothetical protein [Acidobacteriota bacterium]MCL5288342.1 hypothetical protein [Acidobacteriota bacterium]
MLRPAILIRLSQELVFVLLGLLLIRVAALGQFLWDPKSQIWIALGALLFVLGVRAWLRAGKYVTRWEHRVRGASLVLLGACMLTITLAPYGWIAALLGTAGGVLVLRGVVMAWLVPRTK